MKKILTFLIVAFFGKGVFCQGVEIKSSGYVRASGAAILSIKDGGLINNGSYTKGTEEVIFSGTVAKTISGSSNTTMNNLSVTNTGGITTQLGLLTTNLLTIASGSKLTIAATKAVTATGNTSLGSAQCLVLKSDATGTASFIDNGTIGGSGTALVERYLTKYSFVPDFMFHFISSPVANQLIENEFITLLSEDITDFYKWDEGLYKWISYRKGDYTTGDYHVLNPDFGDAGKFISGKGYMVAYPADVTKNFVGVPVTGTVNVTCTNTASGGWNLIGNPYPSGVDWDYIWNNGLLGNGMDNALYYYDNAAQKYKYYIKLTGGFEGGTKDIPPMQGIMVHAKTSGTQTVSFTQNSRSHSGLSTFWKDAPLTTNILDLKIEGNNQTDYARICFFEEATENFDGDFDAFKMFSYSETRSELYSVTTNLTKLAINTLPLTILDGGSVPVSFKVGTPGNYTLSAERMNSFATNTYITLEDNVTGALQKLNDNPVYVFSATSQDITDRFVLHFKDATSINDPSAPEIVNAWYHGGSLVVRAGKGTTDVSIFNVQGQILKNYQLHGSGLQNIDVILPVGVYVARLINDGKMQTVKMIVQ
jgi:hypothetical protein